MEEMSERLKDEGKKKKVTEGEETGEKNRYLQQLENNYSNNVSDLQAEVRLVRLVSSTVTITDLD